MPAVLSDPATRPLRRSPRLVDESGVRLGLAHAALLVLVAVVVAAHVPPAVSLVLVAALSLAAAARGRPAPGAVLVGLLDRLRRARLRRPHPRGTRPGPAHGAPGAHGRG